MSITVRASKFNVSLINTLDDGGKQFLNLDNREIAERLREKAGVHKAFINYNSRGIYGCIYQTAEDEQNKRGQLLSSSDICKFVSSATGICKRVTSNFTGDHLKYSPYFGFVPEGYTVCDLVAEFSGLTVHEPKQQTAPDMFDINKLL